MSLISMLFVLFICLFNVQTNLKQSASSLATDTPLAGSGESRNSGFRLEGGSIDQSLSCPSPLTLLPLFLPENLASALNK